MRDLSDWLSAKIDETVRSLLETKHLYQTIVVNQRALVNELRAELIGEQAKGDFDEIVAKAEQALSDDWHILDELSRQRPRYPLPAGMEYQPKVAISFGPSTSLARHARP